MPRSAPPPALFALLDSPRLPPTSSPTIHLFLSVSTFSYTVHDGLYVYPFSLCRILFCPLTAHPLLVRFLELVRPFMSILPEVTAPEKKVRVFQPSHHICTLYLCSRRVRRSFSTTKSPGQPSPSSSSSSALRFRSTASCPPTPPILFTGFVLSSLPTGAP